MKFHEFFECDFEEDLAWSEDMGQWAFYLLVLKKFFPYTADWTRIKDLLEQKRGKDIVLIDKDSLETRIQIKARRSYYGEDLCIEYRHDFDNGNFRSGWIEKGADIKFLVYCIPSVGFAWKISWRTLVEAWKLNKKYWIDKYEITPSRNSGYYTRNCAVPFEILSKAGVIYVKREFRE